MLPFFNNVYAGFAVFLGFCFLIFIHELGHYLAAVLVGVKVRQFAIGMGPAIFAYRKGMGFRAGSTEDEYNQLIVDEVARTNSEFLKLKEENNTKPTEAQIDAATAKLGLGECEYRVSWFPLGGYVMMLGQEDGKPDAINDSPRSYSRKSVWARGLILIAGVTMNLISGLIMFIVAFSWGVAFPPAIVGSVIAGEPAARAIAVGHEKDPAYLGLKPGDKIITFNDSPVTDFSEVAVRIALTQAGQAIKLGIERDGQPLTYFATPEMSKVSNLLALGIVQPTSLKLSSDLELPPSLATQGVKKGMVITSVNGKPVTRFDQVSTQVMNAKGVPVEVAFGSQDGKETVNARIGAEPDDLIGGENARDINLLGLAPGSIVDQALPETPAVKAGLQSGDVLIQVGKTTWPSYAELGDILDHSKSTPLELTVLRDGKQVTLPNVTPDSHGKMGILREPTWNLPIVAKVLPGSAFSPLNLTPGSKIVSINGQKVSGYSDMLRVTLGAISAPDQPTKLDVEYQINLANAAVSTAQVTLTPDQNKQLLADATPWAMPFQVFFEPLRMPLTAGDPIGATVLGIKKTHQFMLQTYVTIQRLFERSVPLSEARGPLGIVTTGVTVYKQGVNYFLFFMGLISVNLVVMNMLPIPVLDGGQILFLIIEKVKGSPVSVGVQTVATYIAIGLLGSLMLATFIFDVVRLL